MRSYYKKGLAFLLAMTMVVGDFLPAAAAEPEGLALMAEQENTAEDLIDSVEEAADEMLQEETVVQEQPDSEEEPEVSVEEIEETAEAAAEEQAAESDSGNVLVLDTEMTLAAGMTEEFSFTPSETGYYYVEKVGYLNSQFYDADDNWIETIDIPSGGQIICYTSYLQAGETYRVWMNDYRLEDDTEDGDSVYYLRKAENVPEIKTLAVDEGQNVASGADAFFKYSCPVSGKFYIGVTSGEVAYFSTNNVSQGASVEQDGVCWYIMNSYGNGSVYLSLAAVSQDTKVVVKEQVDLFETITDWKTSITVPANSTKYFEFETEEVGAYFIETNENLSFQMVGSYYAGDLTYVDSDGRNYQGAFIELYDYMKEKGVLQFSLTNSSDETLTVTPIRDTDLDKIELTLNETVTYPADKTLELYSFTAPETGFYQLSSSPWPDYIYRESDGTRIFRTSEILLEKGETCILFLGNGASEFTITEYEDCRKVNADEFVMETEGYYAFVPTRTGRYYADSDSSIQYYDRLNWWMDWELDAYTDKYYLDMEAGKTYFLQKGWNYIEGDISISPANSVTVLDYDYYNAFLASGGSVSVDENGELSILENGAGWLLVSRTLDMLKGSSNYDAGNTYWKDETVGAYTTKALYRIGENGLEELSEEEVQDGDIVVAEYAPEIVWVQSMELSLDEQNLKEGDTAQLKVTLDKGQDKYDFVEEPVLRWESSAPEIVSVDEAGEITALKAGMATITVYADEDLREQEGLTDIVTASIDVTVETNEDITSLTILDYDYYNAFLASGGSVSFDTSTGELSIVEKTAGWLLQSVTLQILEGNLDAALGNVYWKNEEDGAFAVKNYYNLKGELLTEEEAENEEVVLVEYAPEIVWVQSMELSLDEQSLKEGDTAQLKVTLDKGQDKYDFVEEPVLRWESSAPEIVSVDENGEITAHKTGSATITVYADEALRKQEGLDTIVSASIDVTVEPGKDITILDYDYYNAFLASGGSVSFDEGTGELSIVEKTAGWLLKSVTLQVLGGNLDAAQGNVYWKNEKDGAFAVKNYYNLKGELLTEEEAVNENVVLVEYAPEIVWVRYIDLYLDKENLTEGDTAQIRVELTEGQDKYDFVEEPVLRWESSAPEILNVDQNGKVTALRAGTATITVYADEDLRAQEGLTDIVSAPIDITVKASREMRLEQEKYIDGEGALEEFSFVPEKTGHYFLEEKGNLSAVIANCNTFGRYPVNGEFVYVYTLEKGVEYLVQCSGDEGDSMILHELEELPSGVKLMVDEEQILSAGENGYFEISGEPGTRYCVGISSGMGLDVSCNEGLTSLGRVHYNDTNWYLLELSGSGSGHLCISGNSENGIPENMTVVLKEQEAFETITDIEEISDWNYELEIPAGTEKVFKFVTDSIHAYLFNHYDSCCTGIAGKNYSWAYYKNSYDTYGGGILGLEPEKSELFFSIKNSSDAELYVFLEIEDVLDAKKIVADTEYPVAENLKLYYFDPERFGLYDFNLPMQGADCLVYSTENGIVESTQDVLMKPGETYMILMNAWPGSAGDGSFSVVRTGLPNITWVKSMSLSAEKNQTTLEEGDTTQLTAALDYGKEECPEGGSEITWYSSDQSIAEVDENGFVTAKKPGNVTITAYADEVLKKYEAAENPKGSYPEVKASIQLTICKKKVLTGLKVIPGATEYEIPYDKDWQDWKSVIVTAAVRPNESSVLLSLKDVRWELLDEEGQVIKTSKTGSFEITEAGNYSIRATYGDGTDVTGKAEISVTREPKPYLLNDDPRVMHYGNVRKNLTYGEIRSELEASLSPEVEEDREKGTFVFKNSKGVEIKDSDKVPAGTNVLTGIFVLDDAYNPGGIYQKETSRDIEVCYGTVALAGYETSNGTLLDDGSKLSCYENTSVITPILTFNGVKYSLEEFSALNGDTVTLSGTVSKDTVLGVEKTPYPLPWLTVKGVAVGTSALTVETSVVYWDPFADCEKSFSIGSKKLNFTVTGNRMVESIEVGCEAMDEEEALILANTEMVQEEAVTYVLDVEAKDFLGEPYDTPNEAKLVWKTSNKKIAYVNTDKNTGEATLVIPKGASGVAEITVTANDANKASQSFQVNVVDTDVRLDTTSLTLNSYRKESGTIYLYPNLLGTVGSNVDIQVNSVKKEGSGKDATYKSDESIFTVDAYEKDKGYVAVHFTESSQKAGKYTLTLEIRQKIDGKQMDPVYKTVTITNKPALPKTTVKQTVNYNTYWKNEEAYAKLLVTTGEPVEMNAIQIAENEFYELAGVTAVSETQYEVLVKAKEGVVPTSKKIAIEVDYRENGYTQQAVLSVSLKAGSVAPAFTVYGVDAYSPSFYPELGEGTVQVLVDIPDSMEKESFSLELTQTAAKYFSITGQTVEDDCQTVDKNGNEISLGKAVLVTLNPFRLAGGTAQFTVTSGNFSKETATTKSLKITAKKVSAVKASLENTVNGTKATAYTFQQQLADSEYLSICPVITDETLNFYTSYAAADKATEAAMKAGQLVIKKIVDSDGNESYLLKATPELYDIKGLSKCKVKVTTYVSSEHGHGGTKALSAVTLTLSLKKQIKAAAVTVTAKVSGSLNVVDPDSSVTITPTIKNLPLGAEICSIELADKADRTLYELSDADYITGKVTLSQASAGEEEDKQALPIGKDSVGILYGYRLTDGSYGTVMAAASVNVVQTAAVKADVKTLTLYNAAPGEAYGKLVTIDVTKAGAAKIASLEITGLEGSGITWKPNENLNELRFYVDEEASRGIEKAYKAKVIVTLENAGTQKGKTVTYTVPITITLKK